MKKRAREKGPPHHFTGSQKVTARPWLVEAGAKEAMLGKGLWDAMRLKGYTGGMQGPRRIARGYNAAVPVGYGIQR